MVMLILVAYGICLGLGLIIVVLLFALSIACLVTDEVFLQLGSLARIVVRRSDHPASGLAKQREAPPARNGLPPRPPASGRAGGHPSHCGKQPGNLQP